LAKNFPLQSILDLSQMRLDEATRRLGALIADQEQAAQRVDLLVQYRSEYHARFLDAAQSGLSPDQWRNYRSFLDRLDSAIDQASDMASRTQQRTADGQRDWLDKRGRVKAFDTLAQRHQAREHYAEARLEQKNLDEHSSGRHAAKAEGER
jgi:flagellar FliJ protein